MSDMTVYAFDAYGTLFDVHSAMGRHRSRLGAHAASVSELWRRKQLEYTWLRSLMGRYADFAVVTEEALRYALRCFHMDDEALCRELLHAYWCLDTYPEAPDVLRRLRSRGARCVVLSNGSPAMLDAAVQSGGIAECLDAVISVDAVAVYKPDPRVYQLVTQRFAVPARAVAFQSANGWDAAGAKAFGFNVTWINRLDQSAETLPFTPDRILPDLTGLSAPVKE